MDLALQEEPLDLLLEAPDEAHPAVAIEVLGGRLAGLVLPLVSTLGLSPGHLGHCTAIVCKDWQRERQRTHARKALAREKVKGLWIAIPTPFTADGGRVDEDALAASVEHYIGALRVDGIFCGGVMGEFWALSLDERERVHELVAREARGRVPVMAQVGHHALPDTVQLCEHAIAHGIDFGIAMNPYYPPSPPDELVRAWYEALAEASPLPMFLFNTMYAGYTLSPELIAELAELDNICGIKNPQGMEHLLRVQELAGDTDRRHRRLRAPLARAPHRARVPGPHVHAGAGPLPATGRPAGRRVHAYGGLG